MFEVQELLEMAIANSKNQGNSIDPSRFTFNLNQSRTLSLATAWLTNQEVYCHVIVDSWLDPTGCEQ